MKKCFDENIDIAGKKVSELTTFQAIRNLYKGIFWATQLVIKKIDMLEKNPAPITIDSKELRAQLKEIESVLLTWDALTVKFVEELLHSTEEERKEVLKHMKSCTVTIDIQKAFATIPHDLPALPIYLPNPEDAPILFSQDKYLKDAYIRKYGVYQEGYKKQREILEKRIAVFKKIFQASADDILEINKDVNR